MEQANNGAGRPRREIEAESIRWCAEQGLSKRRAAEFLGIPESTLRDHLRDCPELWVAPAPGPVTRLQVFRELAGLSSAELGRRAGMGTNWIERAEMGKISDVAARCWLWVGKPLERMGVLRFAKFANGPLTVLENRPAVLGDWISETEADAIRLAYAEKRARETVQHA